MAPDGEFETDSDFSEEGLQERSDLRRPVKKRMDILFHPAVAGNKRGAHLALPLERLDALAGRPLTRIGLQRGILPPAAAARYLADGEWRSGITG